MILLGLRRGQRLLRPSWRNCNGQHNVSFCCWNPQACKYMQMQQPYGQRNHKGINRTTPCIHVQRTTLSWKHIFSCKQSNGCFMQNQVGKCKKRWMKRDLRCLINVGMLQFHMLTVQGRRNRKGAPTTDARKSQNERNKIWRCPAKTWPPYHQIVNLIPWKTVKRWGKWQKNKPVKEKITWASLHAKVTGLSEVHLAGCHHRQLVWRYWSLRWCQHLGVSSRQQVAFGRKEAPGCFFGQKGWC